MEDDQKLYDILHRKDDKYNNDPQLIKLLLDYKGKQGHKKIQHDLFKKIISNYVNLNRELQKKIEEATKLSETDQLTEIYNRVKFSNELEVEISRVDRYQSELTLVMFDIDHFKAVNDNFGHDVGDRVLVKITDIVSEIIRPTDIFARWGGEEFMVLLPNTDLEPAIKVADKLRAKIAQYQFKRVGQVTCSFGVTEFRDDDDADSFIKRVDEALYQAKEGGRNRVVDR